MITAAVVLGSLGAALQTTDTLSAPKSLHTLHTTGGITASRTHIYSGTDTGTIEKRDLEGALVIASGGYHTAAGTATFNTSTNRLGGFTAMDPYAADDVFYFCSEDQNGIFRYNTVDDTMTRMVGDALGQEGLVGTQGSLKGTAAQVSCGLMASGFARNDAKDRVYAFTGKGATSFYGLVVLSATAATGADEGWLTFVLGSGLNAHADGTGTTAALMDVSQIIYYRSPAKAEYLIIASQDADGPFRYVSLANGELKTTAIPYSADLNVSGTGSAALSPYPTGLVRVPGRAIAYGCTENLVFTLSWEADMSSFHVEFHKSDLTPRRGAALTVQPQYVFFGNGKIGPNDFLRFNYSIAPSASEETTAPASGTTPPGSVPSGSSPSGPSPSGPSPPGQSPSGPSPPGQSPSGPNSQAPESGTTDAAFSAQPLSTPSAEGDARVDGAPSFAVIGSIVAAAGALLV